MTRFYVSSPFKTSPNSNSPTVSKLQNHVTSLGSSPSVVIKALEFSRTLRTPEVKTPILEAHCRYPTKNPNPSPATLATKHFLNKLSLDIEESPLTDSVSRTSPKPTGQESNSPPEAEVLETLPTHFCKSLASKTSALSCSPESLTEFHSSDLVDTSVCTSSLVLAETSDKSCCTSSRKGIPPRNVPRKLFRRLCKENEETQLKTDSSLMNDKIPKASPVVAQSENVSFKTSTCTQEFCSTNIAGKLPLQFLMYFRL